MEYLEAVRRHWLPALLVLLAVMVPTTVANVLAPPQYSASTRLWVGVGGGEGVTDLSQKVSTAADLMSTYPELVRSPLVLDPVISKLGLTTDAAGLSERVTATVPNDSLVLTIQVTDDDAARAAAIANAVGEQFGTAVAALPQVSTIRAAAVDTTVLQAALPPAGPSSPQVVRNLAIALVLGLVLAVITSLAFARYLPGDPARRRTDGTGAAPTWD